MLPDLGSFLSVLVIPDGFLKTDKNKLTSCRAEKTDVKDLYYSYQLDKNRQELNTRSCRSEKTDNKYLFLWY
jgi:hypothetical protein